MASAKTPMHRLIKQRYEEKGEKVIVRSHPESDNFYGRTAKKALLGQGKINRLKASVVLCDGCDVFLTKILSKTHL